MPLSLADLPPEVLENIFAHLSRKDVKRLALTSRAYRASAAPYVMRQLRASWGQLVALQDFVGDPDLHPRGALQDLAGNPDIYPRAAHPRLYCERLSICEPNAYYEYQQDTFGKLVARAVFPRLKHVSVLSASLSHWLKYNTCAHIQSVQIENAAAAGGSGRKVFCLDHVRGFAALALLTLTRFHFDWLDLGPSHGPVFAGRLRDLALHDCTWQYPFNLVQFNAQHSLRTLAITYSHDHSFVLLERFVDFLIDPLPQHLASLRRLEVGFVDFRDTKKVLTLTLMATFLRVFPGLDHLYLHGWHTTRTYAHVILAQMTFDFPVDVDVEIEAPGPSPRGVSAAPRPPVRWKQRLYNRT
ncbi:hypothetical protein METBIDRAFT_42398 [Metschnikowia bicuspidata var. bicuspidata NRRL YB-4993]|uniref:F-box domain-containing protein n=1 Tax=Metschnikowia bicuspidata var. bicuspidata NRRL YB-4993 TaxID=869754 RepID=A0A1A0HCE4_9ASCO|nr:hypothetical protein METBIDRAFT_42398 [Metschnikowia bicuspidata var. bicuspidata NRRL YB-4993]OBA21578.1 hypothetical protein METBIDRAFT_42398 [Metschnikowia bicuspidata var. bicuspidata NRRL YB-4993]